jgi:hypothetical protein
MFLIFMFVVKDNGRACAFRDTTARLRSKRRRHKTFGHARDSELIEKCRSALAAERNDKASFDPIYYLDALPTVAEMKSSVAGPAPQRRVLRLFRWGLAQSPNAARRPLQGKEEDFRQAACRRVGRAGFVEARDAFVSDPELRECRGAVPGSENRPGENVPAQRLVSCWTLHNGRVPRPFRQGQFDGHTVRKDCRTGSQGQFRRERRRKVGRNRGSRAGHSRRRPARIP